MNKILEEIDKLAREKENEREKRRMAEVEEFEKKIESGEIRVDWDNLDNGEVIRYRGRGRDLSFVDRYDDIERIGILLRTYRYNYKTESFYGDIVYPSSCGDIGTLRERYYQVNDLNDTTLAYGAFLDSLYNISHNGIEYRMLNRRNGDCSHIIEVLYGDKIEFWASEYCSIFI